MMQDSDFPDLQDLDSLHLEDYQLMQERLNEKNENLNRGVAIHCPELDKPDLLNQDSSQADPFKLDLLGGCTDQLSFIPHLETLESVLGSFHHHHDNVQDFGQILEDDAFLHHPSFGSGFAPVEVPQHQFKEVTVEVHRSSSASPPVAAKNQKRLSSSVQDDACQMQHDDVGKKKKLSDVETCPSADFKAVPAPRASADRPAPKRAPRKASDGESGPTADRIPRHKRPSHINAEQRRRSKIQNCLDQLHEVVPAIAPDSSVSHQSSSNKKSKASILYKSANCCRLLKSKTRDLESETDALRAEIKTLCRQIKEYQSKLPESGATSDASDLPTRATVACISAKQRFEDYAHISTLRNWKFWIFSLFARPLFSSYWGAVGSSVNKIDFRRKAQSWVREDCKLSILRGVLTDSLLTVSSRTSAVGDASNLPVESIRESMRDAGIDLFVAPLDRPGSR